MQKNITQSYIITSTVAAFLLISFALSTPFAAHAAVDTSKVKKTVDATCMQTAVDTRETAIAEVFTTFNTGIIAALTVRKTALHDAWGMSDATARNTAIKKAWTDWKTAKKTAHTKLKNDRKAAWDSFKTTAKTSCKVVTPKDEGLEKDASGTISL
jgi:hypothetical protein